MTSDPTKAPDPTADDLAAEMPADGSPDAAFAALLSRPARRTVHYLAYDPDAAAAYRDLESAHRRASLVADGKQATAIQKAEAETLAETVTAARAALDCVEFHLRALAPKVYRRIGEDHTATPSQRQRYAEAGMTIMNNPDTFPGALIEACCTKVVMPDGATMAGITTAQWSALYDGGSFTFKELDEVVGAAVELHNSSAMVAALAGKG